MSTLEDWTVAVCADLDITRPDTNAILRLAREVAHSVDRPAAPLTAYLVGVAVGRGLDTRDAIDRVSRLAAEWPRDDAES